jgi:uncharacterized surface protein with fasciclin (FAS1) repeats
MKHTNIAALLLTSLVAVSACGDNLAGPGPKADAKPSSPDAPPVAQKTIAELAAATPTLSDLVIAVGGANDNGDLTKLISDPGTLTVFAPTNAAFEKLAKAVLGPTATAAQLLVPANKVAIRAALLYHVLGTEVKAAAIQFGKPVTAKNDKVFVINPGAAAGAPPVICDAGGPNANIVMTDIDASNGVVHVIDAVLTPPILKIGELVAAQKTTGPLSVLKEALGAGGVPEVATLLNGAGPFTVFAPTNDGFTTSLADIGVADKAALLRDKDTLTKVLKYHALGSTVYSGQITFDTDLMTAQGETFKIDSMLMITDKRNRKAKIITTDLVATNGVVHIIDKVLLPAP